MIRPEIEILLISIVVAIACALPGVFLVLRRMALMSDAISHSILLGIVLGFFVAGDVTSPLLILGAAATGVLTVMLVELLNNTRLVKEDAAIGLVFPVLFSVGVILIARYAGNVHLDTDAVLLGELVFAPFERVELNGMDLGPRVLWVMLAILALNAAFLAAFYKELKLTTFDAGLAAALGFSPTLLHYLFMSLVSVTAVGAFDAVGSILVVAMMIGPPAAAYLAISSGSEGQPAQAVPTATPGWATATRTTWCPHRASSTTAPVRTMQGVATATRAVTFSPWSWPSAGRRSLLQATRMAHNRWT
mgnify:CR=1 FL=1